MAQRDVAKRRTRTWRHLARPVWTVAVEVTAVAAAAEAVGEALLLAVGVPVVYLRLSPSRNCKTLRPRPTITDARVDVPEPDGSVHEKTYEHAHWK